jgi:hypothetical protein
MGVRDIVQKILDELGLPGDEYRFVLQSAKGRGNK